MNGFSIFSLAKETAEIQLPRNPNLEIQWPKHACFQRLCIFLSPRFRPAMAPNFSSAFFLCLRLKSDLDAATNIPRISTTFYNTRSKLS